VRVRTLLTLSTGAALGAGVMYLLDPEHGPDRRREARREAARRGRASAAGAVTDARRRVGDLTLAAMAGYEEARGSQRR
jgi:hypothetical protein